MDRKTLEIYIKTDQLARSIKGITKRTVRCDVENIFSSVKLLGTEEAGISKSISFFAEVKSKTILSLIQLIGNKLPSVFVKVTFKSLDPNYNQYDLETLVYEYLGNLRKYNISPNIMNFLVSFTCDDFGKVVESLKNFGVDINRNFIQNMLSGYEHIYDSKVANFLVTERGKGNKLYALLTDRKTVMTTTQFKSLVFQVLYTLQELYNVGIRHNDTHLNNVWVNMSSAGATNPGVFEGREATSTYVTLSDGRFLFYSIPTGNYTAKLYDFDLAGKSDDPKNEFLKTWNCPNTGACNPPSRAFDALNFMYSLWISKDRFECVNASGMRKFVTKLMEESVKDKTLFDIIGNYYNVNSQRFENFQKCCGFYHGKLCGKTGVRGDCMENYDLPLTAFDPFPLEVFDQFLNLNPKSPFLINPANSKEEIKKYPFYVSLRIQNIITAGNLANKMMVKEQDVMDTSGV